MVLKKYKNILLKNGTIIDVVNGKTSKKDLLIKNGKIDQLGKVNSKKEYHIIDCKNKIELFLRIRKKSETILCH